MVDELWKLGAAQQLGIFFFLFLAVTVGGGRLFWAFVQRVMAVNEQREQRYLDTIAALANLGARVDAVDALIGEVRTENREGHRTTHGLIGRVLDRLGAGGR